MVLCSTPGAFTPLAVARAVGEEPRFRSELKEPAPVPETIGETPEVRLCPEAISC